MNNFNITLRPNKLYTVEELLDILSTSQEQLLVLVTRHHLKFLGQDSNMVFRGETINEFINKNACIHPAGYPSTGMN